MSSRASSLPSSDRRRSGRGHVSTSATAQDVYHVEAVVCRSLHPAKTASGEEEYFYLVRWEGYDSSYDTWEPRSNLNNSSQSLKEYEVKETPFSILDVRSGGAEYLVRFGISTRYIEPSPYYPKVWMTVEEIKEHCRHRTVDLAVKLFHRELEKAANSKPKRQATPKKSAARRSSGGPNPTSLVIHAAKRKSSGKHQGYHFHTQWREKGQEVEDWLTRNQVHYRFGDAGRRAIKEFHAQDCAPTPAPSSTHESDYDRERRRNIEENQLLMRELGL